MRYSVLLLVLFTVACAQPTPVGKRVSLAAGKISLILLNSNFTIAKPFFWGPDCSSCDYTRTYFFHNSDSTITTGVTVKVYPDTLGKQWPWKWLFNEQQTRADFTAKHRGSAVIEKLTADSSSRTVIVDAHFNRQGHQSFMKEITVRQGQHKVRFDYLVPDTPQMREAVSGSQASIIINKQYLAGPAESYENFRNHP